MSEERIPLNVLAPGEVGVVRQLAGGRGFVSRLAALGFTLGAEVTMVQNFGHGPLIVLVRDTRVALGRGEAMKVLVETATNGQ
jgi:ferrous iron transport protein A